MSKIKVLVTGSEGQLGKTIQELFLKNALNIEFVFLNRLTLDITNTKHVNKVFNNQKYDYCINCAAYTNVEQAEKTPEIAYKVNAEGVRNLANICKDNNVILIHISTDYVFDGEKIGPYTTEDKTNPINEYGKSKLLGEKYIQDYLDYYFIVRTSWLYSKNHGQNFYRTILKKVKTEKELHITKEQIGCPTDTVNLSIFIMDLITLQKKKIGIYHYCDEKAMTWYDFAEQILKEKGISNQIELVEANKYITFAKRPKNSVLTNTKY